MVSTNYVSDAEAHHFNFVDGVITGATLKFGWPYSSKLGRVSFGCFSLTLSLSKLTVMAEMVLFHASFVALKSRCPLTVTVNSDDFRLSGEKRLFQA
jgi:hypothetical protein